MEPIGHLKSLFKFKNGTPRQAGVCSTARGILTISKSIFNNPEHSLEGLEEFSHAWIIFIFHKNNNACVKAKVRPPRLNGKRIGVFATRAPYRPNPIGLTLAKIEKISDAEIHFSGIDLLDGTPVLDVKPYIPQYDDPLCNSVPFQSSCNVENPSSDDPVTNADHFLKPDQVSLSSQVETKLGKQINVDQVSSSSSSSQLESNVDHVLETNQLQTNVNQLEKTNQVSPFSEVEQKEDNSLEIDQPFHCQALRSDSKTNAEHSLPLPTTSIGQTMISITNPGSKRTYSADLAFKDTHNDDTCSVAKHSFQSDTSVSSKSKDSSKLPECYTDKFLSTNDCLISKDCLKKEDSSVAIEFKKNYSCESWVNPANQNLPIQASGGQVKNPTITASWVTQAPVSKLTVIFSIRSKEQLLNFSQGSDNPAFRLQFLQNTKEVYQAISDILAEDPRSIYRRNTCKDSLYHFAVDSVHVTCWFFDHFAEILFVQPASYVPQTKDP